ncbi:hypothetical protein AX16_000415 [Volvariella volvacea WC 439]|nr:hypothetical protein AX16_000415 [Volvariella volvacea WC 439]
MCAERAADLNDVEWTTRIENLKDAGARIFEVAVGADGRLSLAAVLHKLKELGIQSVMVEGGAQVIASFIAEDAHNPDGIIDTIILTIAPTFVGSEGVGYDIASVESSKFVHSQTITLGKDSVVALLRQ